MNPAPEELHGPGSQMAVIIQERRAEGETDRAERIGADITANTISDQEFFLPIMVFHAKICDRVLYFSQTRSRSD